MAASTEHALGPDGPFAQAVAGYTDRPAQRGLAASISRAIDENAVLVAEAGTGIGKTFAYLVPALLAQCKVLISTGTKNLQDQLFARDLPAVTAALGIGPTTALLKGRSNYLCRHHLEKNLAEGTFERRADVAMLQRIERFGSITRTGDRAEAPGIPEDAPAWALATSTRDNCLGQDCPHIDNCFVFQARRKAMQADVVVINHHLFCADLALRDEGVSELLPTAQVLIFDEAHQLPETATQFFGHTVSTRQVIELARDCLRVGHADAPDATDWLGLSAQIEQSLRELRLAAGHPRRVDEQALREPGFGDFFSALSNVGQVLESVGAALIENAERSKDLDMLRGRCQGLMHRLALWTAGALGQETVLAAPGPGKVEDPKADTSDNNVSAWDEPRIDSTEAATDATDIAAAPVASGASGASGVTATSGESIHWLDIHRNGMSLHRTPLSVAEPFRRQIDDVPRAWIFTSATLSIGENFSLFTDAMGLDDAATERYDSPFDFQEQALLYVPQGIGEPRGADFAKRLLDDVMPLLRANAGRAFFLCTTLRMVDTVAARLREEFDNTASTDETASDERVTILAQGSASREMLLAQFREHAHPVLVGSASFWEGVDVVGQQLSMVIIDKLPFAPPDDPVIQARSQAMRRRGIQPFIAMHLPRAGMALKQGAGRLIRSEKDRGLLVIGDVRLAEKPYGRKLLKGLPPFKRTRLADEALAFVRARH